MQHVVVFLGAVLLLAGCASPPLVDRGRETTSGRAMALRLDSGIRNFARVTPSLYRGGQPREDGFAELARRGVRTIVNLRRHHDEAAAAARSGLAYERIPLEAGLFGSTAPTDEQVRRFLTLVTDPARQPVFVHCAHGSDRTGTMIALYRIQVEGWTNEEAIEEMQAFGYHDVYRDLIDYVRAFHPFEAAEPAPTGAH